MALQEYKPGTTFPGVIGRTIERSSPAWPRPLRAREGSPNVLLLSWMTPDLDTWVALDHP